MITTGRLIYLFYLFNRFHHDHNAKIRLGRRNTFEEVTRTRDEGTGHTTKRDFKLSVPLIRRTGSVLKLVLDLLSGTNIIQLNAPSSPKTPF